MSPTAPKTPAAKAPAKRTPAAAKATAAKAAPAAKAAKPGEANSLTNEHILLTGATGFVGQAILERLLSSFPHTTVSTLVRPKGSVSG